MKIPSTKKGFTLIEVVVSTGVFIVVVVIAVGALTSLLNAHRKALAQKAVINNIHFAVDSMVRMVRVGGTYHCDTGSGPVDVALDCTNGTRLAFEKTGGNPTTDTDQVVFRIQNNRIERSLTGGSLLSYAPMTAPEVFIENLWFTVTGTDGTDNLQPKVLIVVSGYVGQQPANRTDFDIQTLVSQRIPD